MRTIQRQIVSALIYSADHQLLMGMKDPLKGSVHAYCWHIPGGGVEAGEDMIAALIHEVKEETDIDNSQSQILLVDDKGQGQSEKILKVTGEKVMCEMKFYVYKVELAETAAMITVTPTGDLIYLEWFDAKRLQTAKLTPPSEELFKRLNLIK